MYIDDDHSFFLLQRLSSLRHNKELCDIELKVGGTSLFAHRVVLAAVSDYFHAMFAGKLEESMVRTISLHDMDEKAILSLVDYAYTGHITFSVNNVQSLIVTANMLHVQKVVDVCCRFLENKLHVSNCLSFLDFADRHSLQSLKEASLQHASENFVDLTQYDEYLYQSSNIIRMVLSNDNLNVHNEETVFRFLEQWLIFDEDLRIEQFFDLINEIRLPQLNLSFLRYLKTHSLMSLPSAYHFQLRLNNLARLKENPFRLLDDDIEKNSSGRRSSNGVIIIGGQEGLYQPLDSCSTYTPASDTFKSCKSLPSPRFNSAAAYLNGEVYLAGGMCCSGESRQSSRICTSSVLCYSLKTENWSVGVSMIKPRSYLVVVSHGGFIYAMGGYDGKSCLKSIERYNLETKRWCFIQDMRYTRSSFAAVTLEEHIYVLGGQGSAHLSTVERYNTKKELWELMPAMNTKRINFGAAQVHGFIFVVGGHDGQNYLRSMERFDPHTSEWTVVAPLSSPRTGLGVVVLNDEIYVIGGHNGSQYLKSCIKYFPRKDRWEEVGDMGCARCYMAVTDFWI